MLIVTLITVNKYTKQEIPDYLKYHSDDSDSIESNRLNKNKSFKGENNIINIKNKNLIIDISDKKYLSKEKNTLEEDNIKNCNENNNINFNKVKNYLEDKEINETKNCVKNDEEIKKDLMKKYKEDLFQDEEIHEKIQNIINS